MLSLPASASEQLLCVKLHNVKLLQCYNVTISQCYKAVDHSHIRQLYAFTISLHQLLSVWSCTTLVTQVNFQHGAIETSFKFKLGKDTLSHSHYSFNTKSNSNPN